MLLDIVDMNAESSGAVSEGMRGWGIRVAGIRIKYSAANCAIGGRLCGMYWEMRRFIEIIRQKSEPHRSTVTILLPKSRDVGAWAVRPLKYGGRSVRLILPILVSRRLES
jgi:hypothetical protein